MKRKRHVDLRHVALLLATCVAACATHTGTVVLLPANDGHASALVVQQADRQVLLDQPYAAAELTSRGPRGYTSNAAEIEASFGPALAAQPSRPKQFTLYFLEGTNEFTDESKRVLDSVLTDIAQHKVPDIVVVGHTDSVGTAAVNDALSRQRADTVRTALIGRGIAADSIVVVGRGKREPVVPTPDGVAEPRNRRVEILVR
jgi:OmpA-OmpF porin, OOP family